MPDAKTYEGSCHCGNVKFEVKTTLERVVSCNCSICSRAGYLLNFVPAERFRLVSGEDSPQMTDLVLHGAKGNDALVPMAVPDALTFTSRSTPPGVPTNVGQMYTLFARAIRGGDGHHPTFDTAVGLHRLIDGIRRASADGREATVD